jgi:hypothetical protein
MTVACKKDNTKRVEYCELGIILTKDFESYDHGGAFNEAYSDGKTVVGITRYSFVDCEEYGFLSTFTPLKFAEVYLNKMEESDGIEIERSGDVPYFCFSRVTDEGAYFYMPTFYRTPYAYFVITFITPLQREASGRAEFLEYAGSVYILNEYLL